MQNARYSLPVLALVLLIAPPATGQTFGEIGTWQYVKGGGAEAIYTESTDANRTFSLAVNCEDGKPTVTLEFLLAASGDNIGFKPDRFGTDARLAIWLDSKKVDAASWSFSSDSEKFVTDSPGRFAKKLARSETMRMRVWDATGTGVGSYRFDLSGVSSALGALSCYRRSG